MNKYAPLTRWLHEYPENRVTLSFTRVEEIIGASLPASSYDHIAHWRGKGEGRPGGAITAARWTVDILDQSRRSVTLSRSRSARSG